MTLPGYYQRPKLLAFLVLQFFAGLTLAQNMPRQAIASIYSNTAIGYFVGFANFSQPNSESPVTIVGRFNISEKNSVRGMHVHASGNLTQGCISTGSHLNPTNQTHGSPTDAVRHAGDLGNIKSDDQGWANLNLTLNSTALTLFGDAFQSAIGSAIVIHSGADDLGKGNNSDSLKTGNAGERFACGIVGKGDYA